MPQESNDYKVAIFGGAAVGKTSLVQRFVSGTFKDTHVPTVEDTYRKVVSSNQQICTLQITDTTGSHQFPAMQRLAIQRAQAHVLVYSVASRQSLETIKGIYKEIVEVRGGLDAAPLMLAGNKAEEDASGASARREVPSSEGAALAAQWKCGYLETSAKTNKNVMELFEQLLQLEKKRCMTLNLGSGRKAKGRKKEAAAVTLSGKQRMQTASQAAQQAQLARNKSAASATPAPAKATAATTSTKAEAPKSTKSSGAGTSAAGQKLQQQQQAKLQGAAPNTDKEKCEVM